MPDDAPESLSKKKEDERREARRVAKNQRRAYASAILDDFSKVEKKLVGLDPIFADVLHDIEKIKHQIQSPRDSETQLLSRRLKIEDTVRTLSTAKSHISKLIRAMQRSESSREYILESFEENTSAFE